MHLIHKPLYHASKAAVVSVAKSLQGLRKIAGIRDSSICPVAVHISASL